MRLYMIRHLPTAWNKKGLLQGGRDIPIEEPTEDYLKQISENKEELEKNGPYDRIFTSTLRRTQQTAELYGAIDVVQTPMLNELDFGTYEGKYKRQLEAVKEWKENPRGLILGESLLLFEKRVMSFIVQYRSFRKLLVFGHGSWIRAVLSIKEHGDISAMNKVSVKNNELYVAEFDDKKMNEFGE